MYNIGIIEIKCANHAVAHFCKVLNPSINNITLFTTQSMLPRIIDELGDSLSKINIILKNKYEPKLIFIKRIQYYCNNKLDLIFINSVRNWELCIFRSSKPVAAYIYNISWWFKDPFSFNLYLSKLINWENITDKKLIVNAITGVFIRRLILRNINSIIVEHPSFIEKINFEFGFNKLTLFMPHSLKRYNYNKSYKNNIISFGIVGMIEDQRRDYNIILNVIEKIPDEILSTLRFSFIGKPIGDYGFSIIDRIKNLINKKHIDIFYSEKFVESEIFNREMIRADILISPIIENYRSRTVVEKYTHTKATGGFHDAFSYYKPMIVPKTYNIYPDFKDCFISYRDEEHLLTIIKDLSKNRYKIDSAINAVINAYSIYDEKYIKKCIRSIIYNSN